MPAAAATRPLEAAPQGALVALELTAETLRLLVGQVPVAIVAVDGQGRILYTNHKLDELFGYIEGELIGEPLERLLPDRFRSVHIQHRAGFERHPHNRPMGTGMDLAAQRKDGSEFAIEAGLSRVQVGNASVTLSSIVDVSRRKQNEALLEARVQERTREIERRRQVAESLRDIISLINSSQPLHVVLEHIAEQACALLDADAAAIYRLDERVEPLTVLASFGLPETLRVDGYAHLLSSLPTSSPRESAGGVVAPRRTSGEAAAVSSHYKAQLAIPLTAHDEVFGGIMLYYRAPRRYAAEEIELAHSFGEQAKLALENDRLRAQSAELAVRAERNRIARDLHDSVSQTLFSAGIIAEVLPRLWSRDHEESMRRLSELRTLTRGALAEMRTLLLELRPAALIEVEIGELLRQLVEGASARARVPVALSIDGDAPLSQEVKIACYQIAQEALNNVIKHARASEASVALTRDPDAIQLEVRDNGRGFELHAVTAEHMGLTIMAERAAQVEGDLKILAAPGEGTNIRFTWRPKTKNE